MSYFDPAVGQSHLAPYSHPQDAGVYLLNPPQEAPEFHLSPCSHCVLRALPRALPGDDRGAYRGDFGGPAVGYRDMLCQRLDMPWTRPRHCR